MRTDDPIWDAERAQKDPRKPIAICEYCKNPIYGSDATHYADDAYFDGSIWFCEECKDTYLQQFKISD